MLGNTGHDLQAHVQFCVLLQIYCMKNCAVQKFVYTYKQAVIFSPHLISLGLTCTIKNRSFFNKLKFICEKIRMWIHLPVSHLSYMDTLTECIFLLFEDPKLREPVLSCL